MKTTLNKNLLLTLFGVGAAVGLVMSILGAIPLIGFLTCLLCPVIFVAPIAVGYYASMKHNVNKEEIMDSVLVGAAGAAAAGVGYSLVSSILNFIFGLLGVTISALPGISNSNSVGDAALVGTGFAITGLLCIPVWLVIYAIVSAILGAIGGFVYTLIKNNSVSTPVAN